MAQDRTPFNGQTGLQVETQINNNLDDLDNRKVEVVAGKALSTNDFTDADKSKLDSIKSDGSIDATAVTVGGQSVATLSGGKLDPTQIPDLSISDYLGNFADTTAALADAGVQVSQRGDWFTVDTNSGESYIVTTDSPTLIGHITKIKTPTDAVQSVNGKTGVVVVNPDDLDDSASINKFTTKGEKLFPPLASIGVPDVKKQAGFVNMGKGIVTSTRDRVNQGITCGGVSSPIDTLWMGRQAVDATEPDSPTDYPTLKLNGITIALTTKINTTSFHYVIKFPDAPDGLDKIDMTGRHADIAAAIVAGGTGLTASILNRDDFVAVEVFPENITVSNWWNPLGSTQYELSTFTCDDGRVINLVQIESGKQGYSAYHEGDTVTRGYGKALSALTDDELASIAASKGQNIGHADGQLIQWKYRIRTFAGGEGQWANLDFTLSSGANGALRPSSDVSLFVRLQGTSTYATAYTSASNEQAYEPKHSLYGKSILGVANSRDTFPNAYNGECYLIPIVLVGRYNQGAYHQFFNENGTRGIRNAVNDGTHDWNVTPDAMNSISDCFDVTSATAKKAHDGSGYIDSAKGSFHPDEAYYDGIYAHRVTDLRIDISGKYDSRTGTEELRRRAISGKARGVELTLVTYKPFSVTVESATGERWNINEDMVQPNLSNPVSEAWVYYPAIDKIFVAFIDYSNNRVFPRVPRQLYPDAAYSDNYNASPYYSTTARADYYSPTNVNDTMWVLPVGQLPIRKTNGAMFTNIIGSPSNIATTIANMNADYMIGEWLPEIPDGTSKSFKLTRKNLAATATTTYTTDNGATWSNTSINIDSTANAHNGTAGGANVVAIWNYNFNPNFTEEADNSEVLDGYITHLYANQRYTITNGAVLSQSLIDKVPTVSTNPYADSAPLDKYILGSDSKISSSTEYNPSHRTLSLTGSDSPALKCFFHAFDDNGVLVPHVKFKEMVYDSGADKAIEFTDRTSSDTSSTVVGTHYRITDGTFQGAYRAVITTTIALSDVRWSQDSDGNIRWSNGVVYFENWDGNGFGDNNQFEITDGVSTLTDYNGNTVLYGTHALNDDLRIAL